MKLRKLGFFAASALLASASAGCSGNDASSSGTAGSTPSTTDIPAGFELSCSASTTMAGPIDYVVTGDSLSVSASGQSATLTREGSGGGSRAIYGTWALPSQPYTGDPGLVAKAQLTNHGTFKIEDGRVTVTNVCKSRWATLTAHVTTAATITDTTFEFLEAHEDARKWTAAGGERVVASQSAVPFGGDARHAADPALTLHSSAGFPVAR